MVNNHWLSRTSSVLTKKLSLAYHIIYNQCKAAIYLRTGEQADNIIIRAGSGYLLAEFGFDWSAG
jgi:hypothetical protein